MAGNHWHELLPYIKRWYFLVLTSLEKNQEYIYTMKKKRFKNGKMFKGKTLEV